MITITIETVLIFVIIIITLQLFIVGIYIILLLRDTRRTVLKAESVIDDIDKSVKDGIEKASAMQAPLAALATTTKALNGMMKGATSLKDMTKTVISASRIIKPTNKTQTNNIGVDVKSSDINMGNSQQQNVDESVSVNSTPKTNTANLLANEGVIQVEKTIMSVATAVESVANVFSKEGKASQGGTTPGDKTNVTTNSSATIPNDYSVNDMLNGTPQADAGIAGANGNADKNSKSVNQVAKATSLVDNITKVTPPNVSEGGKDKKDEGKKKRKVRRPRFFRRK